MVVCVCVCGRFHMCRRGPGGFEALPWVVAKGRSERASVIGAAHRSPWQRAAHRWGTARRGAAGVRQLQGVRMRRHTVRPRTAPQRGAPNNRNTRQPAVARIAPPPRTLAANHCGCRISVHGHTRDPVRAALATHHGTTVRARVAGAGAASRHTVRTVRPSVSHGLLFWSVDATTRHRTACGEGRVAVSSRYTGKAVEWAPTVVARVQLCCAVARAWRRVASLAER